MEPKTLEEHYLAAIAGEDVTIPEPRTRQEHYLKEIAENGKGYGVSIQIVEPEEVIIQEQTVTTQYVEQYDMNMAQLSMAGLPEALSVVFDGKTYNVMREVDENVVTYSAEDYASDAIPFLIASIGILRGVATKEPGTHTISAVAAAEVVSISDEFNKACLKFVKDNDSANNIILSITNVGESAANPVGSDRFYELESAIAKGFRVTASVNIQLDTDRHFEFIPGVLYDDTYGGVSYILFSYSGYDKIEDTIAPYSFTVGLNQNGDFWFMDSDHYTA